MPITTFLFARGDPELERAFLAHPRWSKATYRFAQCAGLSVGPEGLLAVDLGDEQHFTAPPAHAITAEPMCRRFSWVRDVLPSPPEFDELIELAQRTRRAIGWFYWHERGDDLYCDAAWVLYCDAAWVVDPSTHHSLGPGLSFTSELSGEFSWARQTALMGPRSWCAWHETEIRPRWRGSPFSELMLRLGVLCSAEYFLPADASRCDWGDHQLFPAL